MQDENKSAIRDILNGTFVLLTRSDYKIVDNCASGTERVVTHDLTSQLVIDVIHISNACFLFKGIIWLIRHL
jgi:hypothetical protein